jgi:hypothetical protein
MAGGAKGRTVSVRAHRTATPGAWLPKCLGRSAIAALLCSSAPSRADEPAEDSSRPAFEAGVLAGPTWLSCAENDCQGDLKTPGFSLGMFGLARPVWWLGAGLIAERSRFAWHPRTFALDAPDEGVHVTTAIASGRMYALQHGWAEPWLGFGFGVVAIGTTVASMQCSTDPGPLVQGMAGFDGYVVPWLRLSSAVLVEAGFTPGCGYEPVPDAPPGPPPTPSPSNAVGIRFGATFALGR